MMYILLLVLLIAPCASFAGSIIGGEAIYRVSAGDSLQLISAKTGTDLKNILKDNDIHINQPLSIGQEIRINNRKIVPKTIENGIVINIPDRTLYYFKDGRLWRTFPVGLGMPSWRGIKRWRTPVGSFVVTGKAKNPTWYVPPSIQWKMTIQNKPVQTIVPPGQDNPLGRYAVYTSIRGIAIHETIWPTTVYKFRSHGCIRLLEKDMEALFEDVAVDTPGEIIYMPVKAARTEDGRIFLEIHPDVYGRVKDLWSEAAGLIYDLGASEAVDWTKVDMVVNEQAGIAVDVTASPFVP